MAEKRERAPRSVPSPPVRGRREESGEKAGFKDTGPTRVCIIVGVVVVVLLAAIGLIFLFGSNGVGSIAVGGVQARESGIWFEVRTTGKGLRSFSGDVDIEILLEDASSSNGWRSIYSTTTMVNDDYGAKEVPYVDFLQGNGDYRISAEADGEGSTAPLFVTNLVTSLDVEWSAILPDTTTPEYYVMVNITYMAGQQPPRNTRYPSSFQLEGQLIGPVGSATLTSQNAVYTVQKTIEHIERGNYRLDATLTNLDCAVGSPGRTVTTLPIEHYLFDAHPFANAGEDQTVKLVDGVAIVDLDAGMSWDDSGITEYSWDFDDGATVTQDKAFVRHIYDQPGNYTVSLTIKDDHGQTSVQDGQVSTAIITVQE